MTTEKKSKFMNPLDSINKPQTAEKVPPEAGKTIKNFLQQPIGILLILKLILLIIAAVCFEINAESHEAYGIIVILEICIIIFFIAIYFLMVYLVLLHLDWNLLELLNCIASAIFLIIVGVVALREESRETIFYVAGVLCIIVAVLNLVNVIFIAFKRDSVRRCIGIKLEPKSSVKLEPTVSGKLDLNTYIKDPDRK